MVKSPRLTVIFSAVTDGFDKGVTNAQKKIAKFEKSVKSHGKAMVKWGSIVAGVSAGALSILVKRQFDALDKVAKLSDRIGIQTEKLAGLELAAAQTGVSNEIFTKSIEKMQAVIGDATLGLSESIKAFDKLGLSFKKIAKLSTFDQLTTLVDALNQVDDATLRASLSADLFGRAGGKELRNFLALGSEGIRGFIREADKMGIAFRRIDLARIEAANDAFDKMKRITNAVAGEIAVNLGGALTFIIDSMNAVGSGAASMRDVVKDAFVSMRGFALELAASIDKINIAYKFVQLGALGAARSANRIVEKFNFFGAPRQRNPSTGRSIEDETFVIAIADLKAEISALLSKDVLPSQQSTFDFFQSITNHIGDSVAKLRTGPKASGVPAFALKDIVGKALGISATGGGTSGFNTAKSLGIVNGQARFGAGGGDSGPLGELNRTVRTKFDALINLLKRIDRRQEFGSGGAVVFA